MKNKNYKFLTIRLLYGFLIMFFTVFFVWIQFAPAFPIKAPTLRKPYPLCSRPDLTTWRSVEGLMMSMSLNKFFLGESDYVGISYAQPANRVLFACKTHIPWHVLYRANLIGLKISANQDIKINLVVSRKGSGGPFLEEKEMKKIPKVKTQEILWQLDSNVTPKANWLTGNYDEVSFFVWPANPGEKLDILIYDVYLK